MEIETASARQKDGNGFITIYRNPISRSGVFQYLGRNLPGAEPTTVYNVYRPPEELSNPDAIASFKGLPIFDEHEMVGEGYGTDPEQKVIHGWTGDDISFENNDLLSNLRIVTATIKSLINSGKKGLSLGYRCIYEKTSGVIDGIRYDYIQRQIRGNHLALVNEGRCGTAVLDKYDVFDHFDLALDTEELTTMADTTAAEATEEKEMSLTEITQALAAIMPFMAKVQEFMVAAAAPANGDDVTTALDGETEETPGDTGEDEDETEEEKQAKKDTEKKDAMDSKIDNRISALEKRGPKELFAAAAARDKLVKEVSPIVGTFDHSLMTEEEVAAYAVKKLEIEAPAGQERAALAGYLKANKKNAGVSFALDSAAAPLKSDGLLAKRINGAQA